MWYVVTMDDPIVRASTKQEARRLAGLSGIRGQRHAPGYYEYNIRGGLVTEHYWVFTRERGRIHKWDWAMDELDRLPVGVRFDESR